MMLEKIFKNQIPESIHKLKFSWNQSNQIYRNCEDILRFQMTGGEEIKAGSSKY